MLPPLPPLPRTWRSDLGRLIALAIIARCVVLALFAIRGLSFPPIDTAGYIAHAEWLSRYGDLSMPDASGGRYFHGVPLLLALFGSFTDQLSLAAYGMNFVFVAVACALFYRNFPRFDWAAWHALILPAWLGMSSTLHSESALWAFSLIGFTALRLPLNNRLRPPLLLVAGYAMACRPTAFFILLPAFIAAWFPLPRANWIRMLLEGLLLGIFPLLIAVWSLTETGAIFIQSQSQAHEFKWWADYWGGSFPSTMFSWPGASFAAMLASDYVRIEVKFFNLAHLVFYAGALLLAARALKRDPADTLTRWLLLGLVFNGVFILTIGGPFGGTIFYRFLATQANVFVLVAWFRYTALPPRLWWGASLASLGCAGLMARNTHLS